MQSKFRQTGYRYADERCSGGTVQEDECVCCAHCQKLLFLRAWRVDGGWCGRCDAYICGLCADRMVVTGCVPFKRLVDDALDRIYHATQNAKVLGL